ncbi:MAG: hypothetical protein OHK0012_09640 [Synechococcales cyanobacterium]
MNSPRAVCHCRRRQVLGGILGLVLGYPATATPTVTAPVVTAPTVAALVLSCIDFRFVPIEQHFLATTGLTGQYDYTALAGASLAIAGFPHPTAARTFWDQLAIAYQLHHVRRVIMIDHQDCGAFALKIDPLLSRDPDRELSIHRRYSRQAATAIRRRYPDVTVDTYWATLDGSVHSLL